MPDLDTHTCPRAPVTNHGRGRRPYVRCRRDAVRVRAVAGRPGGRRPVGAAGRPDASAHAGRGRRAGAPAGAGLAAAPPGRGRRADVADPVRAARHRQDHAGAHRLQRHEPPLRAAVGPQRRGEGRPRGDRAGQGRAHPRGRQTVLFIDEIHRFSKTQQDSLLAAVEARHVTLVAATTENPFFSIVSPLLSRSLLLTLQPLDEDAVGQLVDRALRRRARPGRRGHARRRRPRAPAAAVRRRRPPGADRARGGGRHRRGRGPRRPSTSRRWRRPSTPRPCATTATATSTTTSISAFIKSIRGSDADAALHYLARMLEAGEDPRFIARRLVVHASEDVGLADPTALLAATRRRAGRAADRAARGPDQPGPGHDPPRAGAEVQRGRAGDRRRAGRRPQRAGRRGAAAAARLALPGRGQARRRRSATSTRRTPPTASSPSSTRPTSWSAATTTSRPAAAASGRWPSGWPGCARSSGAADRARCELARIAR